MYDLSGVGLFRTEGIFEIFYKYNMNETYDNINETRALKCLSIRIPHESSHHTSEAVYSAVQCKTVVSYTRLVSTLQANLILIVCVEKEPTT